MRERLIGHESMGLGGYEGGVGAVGNGEAVDGWGVEGAVIFASGVRF